ncbi:hypothetical protein KDW99_06170 [Marinomonas rhizomae]|nr:hypothetical protein [Marinomonas rhizomae]UTW00711.1 hypothetical protein KDW99_06170 [Marinomonas rhizomae]
MMHNFMTILDKVIGFKTAQALCVVTSKEPDKPVKTLKRPLGNRYW